MRRKLFLIGFFLLLVAHSYGQDIITRTDGVEIKSTIREIKPNLITYKLFQGQDTLVYQISPQDVRTIKMADGTIRSFTSPTTSSKANASTFNYETNFRRNIFWFHPLDLIYSNVTLAYEHILASGKAGFKVPLLIGLHSPDDNYNNSYDDYRSNTRFGSGLELNLYPFGQGKMRYFYGPAVRFQTYESYIYFYSDPNSPSEIQKRNGLMITTAIKNGIYYHFSKTFLVSVDIGLGMRFFRQSDTGDICNYTENTNRVYIPGNIHLGIRL